MSGLRRTAVTGFLWQIFGSLGQRGAAFIATLVLARFLPKEDFGVVGVALAIIIILELFRDAGVMNAIITYRGDERKLASTAFWILLIPGVCLATGLIIVAPYLEQAFAYPRLAMVLRGMALAQLLDTFRLVPNALMSRRHMFRERSIAETSAVFIATAFAIGALFMLPKDQQIWALAFMWIVRYVALAILFNLFLPVVPRFEFDREIARKLSRTGMGMLLSNIPSGSTEWITSLFVGARTNEAAMGVFRLGMSLALPASLIGISANTTFFPIFASRREDMEQFIERAVRSIRIVNVLTLAFVGWFIVVARDLVPVLLTDRWIAAVPAAKWITIGTTFKAYTFLCSTPLLACERNSYAAIAWWSTFVAMIGLMPFVPFGRDDSTTPAILFTIIMGTGAVVGFAMLRVGLGVSLGRIATALLPGFVVSGVPALIAWIIVESLPQMLDWQRLLIASGAFGLSFVPLCGRIMSDGWAALLRLEGWNKVVRSPENDSARAAVQDD